jgi:hypothetical protein
MFPCCIKLFFPNLEFLMGRFHIRTMIVIRPSCDECNEAFLATSLFVHVSIGKKVIDNWIIKHELIKFIHN